MPSQLLTVAQVAERLNVTSRTVRNWCANETLPATKFGHIWMIDVAELEEFEPPVKGRPSKAAENAAEKAER